jgi:hypothetical protein
MIWTYIWEVLSSSLGQYSSYPESPVLGYYFDPALTASFQILSNSSVTLPFNLI